MNRGPHLQLLERIKKPPTENSAVSALWRVGSIVIFPLVLGIGFVIMAVVCLTTALNQLLNKRISRSETSSELEGPDTLNPWQVIFNGETLNLYRKNIGEVRFGPGYFELKSIPTIEALNDQTFGDWTHETEEGILLQRWNSTTIPDTDLLLLDTTARTVRIIAKNIPSVQWRVEPNPTKQILLICDTGTETLKYRLDVGPA